MAVTATSALLRVIFAGFVLGPRVESFSLFPFVHSSRRLPSTALGVTPGRTRRVKKNKYAKFSKVRKDGKDPLDLLIEESNIKMRNIEIERLRERNQVVPEDGLSPDVKRDRDLIRYPDLRTIDPYEPTTFGFTELGTIIGAHGVQGKLKVSSTTDFPERLCQKGVRYMKKPDRRAPRSVELLGGKRTQDNEYIIKLKGVGDREKAALLRGAVLYSRREDRPKALQPNEYLIHDLVGLEVFMDPDEDEEDDGVEGSNRRFVGKVVGVVLANEMCSTPGLGQDWLELSLPRGPGATPSAKDVLVLIPMAPQIVPQIDLEEKEIYIDPPNGLLDLTFTRAEKYRIKGFLPPGRD